MEKTMKKDQAQKAPEIEERFYIPEFGKSVSAKDIKEALEKAKE